MKYCTKCGTQTSKHSDACDVCGSLDFCSSPQSQNETETIIVNETYYIGATEVTQEQIKSIEELMSLNQKIEAIKMVRDITGLDLVMAKKYVENHQPIGKVCPQSVATNDGDDLADIPMPKLSDCFCWGITSLLSILLFILIILNEAGFLTSLLFFLIIILCISRTIASISNYSLAKKDFDSYRRKMQSIKAAEKRQQEIERRRQEAENRKQQEIRRKRAEYNKQGIATCPKCGSPSIATVNRGFSIIWGFYGSGKPINVCQKCGHKWEVGK